MEDKVNKNSDNNKEENLETSSKHTEITNDDGSITYLSQTTEKKTGTGIISDPQKVEEISLGVSAEDTKYVDAIRSKKELGILFDDKLITYISVNAFEKILKFMDEDLDNYFDSLSFGIYSSKEINELKESIKTIPPLKIENIQRFFDINFEEDKNKFDKLTDFNDDLFLSVDNELESIRLEEERKKREEEERLRKLEEEQKYRKIIRRNKIKTLFEENMNTYEPIEIIRRRVKQYKEGIEEAKKRENYKKEKKS